jgi:uncharacterized membrane protein (UPF0127 family)
LVLCCASCTEASGRPEPAKASSGSAAKGQAADPRDEAGDVGPLEHGTVVFESPRGAWVIDVELARTPEQRARGLMWRRELQPDHGMLFLFEEERVQSFWMHNTLLSLDMIHLGQGREVVGVVARAEPHTDTARGVGKPARYVLEVGAGEAAAHALLPGAQARFVGVQE